MSNIRLATRPTRDLSSFCSLFFIFHPSAQRIALLLSGFLHSRPFRIGFFVFVAAVDDGQEVWTSWYTCRVGASYIRISNDEIRDIGLISNIFKIRVSLVESLLTFLFYFSCPHFLSSNIRFRSCCDKL